MKQIQIPYSLFMDLCRYHLSGLCDPDIEQRIRIGLQEKADRAAARETYAKNLYTERK